MPQKNASDVELQQYVLKRKSALDFERSSFIGHWQELDRFVRPRSAHFQPTDRNRGQRKFRDIINSHGGQALRVAVAGMLSGTMSPTRPWFQWEPANPDLLDNFAVRIWLKQVEGLIFRILNASNFYSIASTLLQDLILYGTASATHVDDYEDVARFYHHPVGSFFIAQDDRLVVNTLIREVEMSTLQLVQKFGYDNVSYAAKTAYDNGNYEADWVVYHMIEPNPDMNPSSLLARNAPFRSIYLEQSNNERGEILEFSGFQEFPAYIPRWSVTGADLYGTDCPGMTALGDIKGLQVMERRKAQGIDKQVNPPLQGPPQLHNARVNSAAGGLTIYDGGENGAGLRPIYQVTPQLQDMALEIQNVQQRIDTAFFVDLFLAISRIEGIQPRNQLDLTERNQERLLQLGPVLEHIHGELLEQVVTRTFNQAVRAGILPPAPPELQGQELDVRFISSLALAQRAVATTGIERVGTFVQGLAATHPDVVDKFDADQATDDYAQAVGINPKIIVPQEIVSQRREARAQARQEQLAEQREAFQAEVAKTQSEAKLDDDNLLSRQLRGGQQ